MLLGSDSAARTAAANNFPPTRFARATRATATKKRAPSASRARGSLPSGWGREGREGKKKWKRNAEGERRESKRRGNRSRIIGCFGFNEETNHRASSSPPPLIVRVVGVVGDERMPFSRSLGSLHFFYRLFSVLPLPLVTPPPPPPPTASVVLTATQKPSKNMSGRTKRGGLRCGVEHGERAAVKGRSGVEGGGGGGRRTKKRKMETTSGHFLRTVRGRTSGCRK